VKYKFKEFQCEEYKKIFVAPKRAMLTLILCDGGQPLMRKRYLSTNSMKVWRIG